MVKYIPKSSSSDSIEYTLIGTCRVKSRSTFNVNNAVKQLEKFACEKGANLIRIIDHQEVKEQELKELDPLTYISPFYSFGAIHTPRDIIQAELWLEQRY